jgi:superfamily I DNA and/or RNA helicase
MLCCTTQQGTEADVVIISTVRSSNSKDYSSGSSSVTSFMQDSKRINVALSRAK